MTRPIATPHDSKPALAPKLRFPEFRGSDDWEIKPASAIAEILQGYGFPDRHQGKQSGELPFYKVSDISRALDSGSYFIDKAANYIGQKTLLELKAKALPPGTTIFAKIGEALRLNKRAITTRPCVIDNNTAGVKAITGKATDSFLFYLWSNVSLDDYAGGVVPSVNKSTIEAIPVSVPLLGEQRKIAECLSTLDELIGAESRKLDALKAHKKGLMQQLFPREGETLPRLRFPEFHSTPEWEEQCLGSKTIKVGSGITPTGGDKNYKREGRPFMRSQNVGWGVLLLDDIAFIDEETHASFDSTEIKTSDVLLNITGASIGRSAIADERIAGGNVNQHVCIIRVKAEELNPTFLNQFLLSRNGQKQIDSFQAGGNRQGLNFAQIRSFSIPLPPTLAEQHRIATCLSSLDDLIAAQSDKLEALQTHKQGLMQQLFPPPADSDA